MKLLPPEVVVQLERVLHLSDLERRLASTRLGVDLGMMEGPPVAALVGEMPGPRARPSLPLFPMPTASAGARLLGLSGMSATAFLSRFARRNLYHRSERWLPPEARELTGELVAWIRELKVARVVLLGARVAEAFGLQLWEVGHMTGNDRVPQTAGTKVVSIPHPSKNHYDDDAVRRRARAILRWAAGLRRSLP